jgi:steroid 5-alpha reductase family enzyme
VGRLDILGITFAVSLAGVTLCWWWGIRHGNNISLIDGYYGCASFVHAVITYALWDGRSTQGLLVTVVVGLWSLGLGQALARRWWEERAHGGDKRYRAAAQALGMGDGRGDDGGFKWKSYGLAAPQAVLIAILNLPVQLAIMTTDDEMKLPGWLGLAVIAVGGTCEVVANRQLEVFRKAGHPSGSTLMTGLWGWSRHPNYFGNTTVYLGAFVVAMSDPDLWWTVVSPLVILYTLRWGILGTGVHGMDKFMLEKRAGNQAYLDYVRHTPAFVPRPPSLRRHHSARRLPNKAIK